MLAILGGLGAAAAWAVSTLCSSRSSRLIEPMAVVAWVMLVGLVITAPLAAASGVPSNLHGSALAWLALAGVGNVAGLIATYSALRIGQVSLVAPLVSTEGAIAAVISVLAGQTLELSVAFTLLVIALGIGLASVPVARRRRADAARHPDRGPAGRARRRLLRRQPLRHRPRRRRAAGVMGRALGPRSSGRWPWRCRSRCPAACG